MVPIITVTTNGLGEKLIEYVKTVAEIKEGKVSIMNVEYTELYTPGFDDKFSDAILLSLGSNSRQIIIFIDLINQYYRDLIEYAKETYNNFGINITFIPFTIIQMFIDIVGYSQYVDYIDVEYIKNCVERYMELGIGVFEGEQFKFNNFKGED